MRQRIQPRQVADMGGLGRVRLEKLPACGYGVEQLGHLDSCALGHPAILVVDHFATVKKDFSARFFAGSPGAKRKSAHTGN